MQSVKSFNNTFLNGLVAFFGGKRKIVRLIQKFTVGETFCDLFFGGGSVSLYAKATGKRVVAADRSFLSKTIAESYLTNDTLTLHQTHLDAIQLTIPAVELTRSRYVPNLFTPRHALWIDKALTYAQGLRDHKTAWLVRMLIAKFIFNLRAFGAFTNYKAMQSYNFSDHDEILHRSGSYYKNLKLTTHELSARCLKDLNASIFPNGKKCEFMPMDVFDFLKYYPNELHTIYLDPPYYGSQDYENYYNDINFILSGGSWVKPTKSRFNSQKEYFAALEEIIQLSDRSQRMIFSYGGYVGIEECEAIASLMRKYRAGHLELIKIPYAYSIHRTSGNGNMGMEALIVSDK